MIRPGQATSRDITLSVTGDVPLSVEQVKASTDAVTTQVVPEEGGKSCLIHVTYNPEGRTQGRVSERLTIVVGGKDQEVLEVPIYGTIHEAPAPAAQNNPQ